MSLHRSLFKLFLMDFAGVFDGFSNENIFDGFSNEDMLALETDLPSECEVTDHCEREASIDRTDVVINVVAEADVDTQQRGVKRQRDDSFKQVYCTVTRMNTVKSNAGKLLLYILMAFAVFDLEKRIQQDYFCGWTRMLCRSAAKSTITTLGSLFNDGSAFKGLLDAVVKTRGRMQPPGSSCTDAALQTVKCILAELLITRIPVHEGPDHALDIRNAAYFRTLPDRRTKGGARFEFLRFLAEIPEQRQTISILCERYLTPLHDYFSALGVVKIIPDADMQNILYTYRGDERFNKFFPLIRVCDTTKSIRKIQTAVNVRKREFSIKNKGRSLTKKLTLQYFRPPLECLLKPRSYGIFNTLELARNQMGAGGTIQLHELNSKVFIYWVLDIFKEEKDLFERLLYENGGTSANTAA